MSSLTWNCGAQDFQVKKNFQFLFKFCRKILEFLVCDNFSANFTFFFLKNVVEKTKIEEKLKSLTGIPFHCE